MVEGILKLLQYLQAWSDGITTAVAIAALFLSLWTLYLQRIDKRPRLRVLAKSAWLFAGSEQIAEAYAFEVANVGHVPVTVQNVYLRPGHRWNEKVGWPGGFRHETHRLPCRLETGESATWYVDRYPIRMFLKSKRYKKSARVTIIAADGLGNFHKCRTRLYLTRTWGLSLREWWRRLLGGG